MHGGFRSPSRFSYSTRCSASTLPHHRSTFQLTGLKEQVGAVHQPHVPFWPPDSHDERRLDTVRLAERRLYVRLRATRLRFGERERRFWFFSLKSLFSFFFPL